MRRSARNLEHHSRTMAKYHPDFATTPAEAEKRWRDHRVHDPFPEIPQALLSSEHIKAYVRQTAMIYPFDEKDPNRLKSASYEIKPGKQFILWDEHGKKKSVKIEDQSVITLPANSISFIQTEVQFQLPHYIAVRFNLRITHVHRGILLGTGPLIDPGFNGDLLIPLHNLTSEEYVIRADEGLIWVEFTKTSASVGTDLAGTPTDKFVPTDPKKNNKPPEYFFDLANKNRPIRSSLPLVVADAKKLATDAQKSASRAERTNRLFVGGGLLAIAGTVVGIFSYFAAVNANVIAANTLAKDVNNAATQAANTANAAAEDIKTLKAEIAKKSSTAERRGDDAKDLGARLNTATQDIAVLRAQVAALSQDVANRPADVINPPPKQVIAAPSVHAKRPGRGGRKSRAPRRSSAVSDRMRSERLAEVSPAGRISSAGSIGGA